METILLKRLLGGTLPLLLFGCARSVPVVLQPQAITSLQIKCTSSQLYPLQVGWKWVYRTHQRVDDGPIQAGPDHCFRITACQDGPLTHAVMERSYGNFQAPATAVERSQDAVVLSREGHPEQGSIAVLRFPLVPGKSWDGRTWPQAREVITFVGTASIQVPAGNFAGYHLEHRILYQDGRTDHLHYWYAPGVGLVKAIEGLTVDLGQGMQYREVATDLAEYGLR